jgi:hypothetical protein
MSLGVQEDAPYWVVVAIVVGTTTLSIAGHLFTRWPFRYDEWFRHIGGQGGALSSLWAHFSAWLVSSC